MLGCGGGFGAQCREPVSVSEFGHAKGESAYRHDLDGVGERQKLAPQFSAGTSRPGARQRAARSGYDAAT